MKIAKLRIEYHPTYSDYWYTIKWGNHQLSCGHFRIADDAKNDAKNMIRKLGLRLDNISRQLNDIETDGSERQVKNER